jgi:hypothetical protein
MQLELKRTEINVIVSAMKDTKRELELAIGHCLEGSARWKEYAGRPDADESQIKRWEQLQAHAAKMQAKADVLAGLIERLSATKGRK